jgi:molybdopterin-guanine dinucleotide biosynthesis protein A
MDQPGSNPLETVGVLLAGGQSRRMGGGDKCLRPLGGKPMLAHIIERARPQVSTLIVNANGDPARFAAFGLPVVPDISEEKGFLGPLAGVLTGLDWARCKRPWVRWVATFATDAPFFPRDLVARLYVAIARDGADMACARSDGQDHPVFGLWPEHLFNELYVALVDEQIRKVDVWTARYKLAVAEFSTAPFDPFFNANRPEDLAEAERLLLVPTERADGG